MYTIDVYLHCIAILVTILVPSQRGAEPFQWCPSIQASIAGPDRE